MVRIIKRLTGAVSAFVYSSVSSRVFFLSALVSLPAFLLIGSLPVKAVLTLFYILFMLMLGKGFRLLPNLMILLSITLLNLFTPVGRVLVSAGPFVITRGALDSGIMKSVTFIGLIYLSRMSVRRDLEFPGKLGALLSRTFFYFDMMAGAWKKSGGKREGLIVRLDNLFYSVSSRLEEGEGKEAERTATTWKGWVYATLFAVCHWGLFLYTSIRSWS